MSIRSGPSTIIAPIKSRKQRTSEKAAFLDIVEVLSPGSRLNIDRKRTVRTYAEDREKDWEVCVRSA
jgi:hypothetical protein